MIPAGYGKYAKAAVAVEKKEEILLMLLDTASMDLKKARMGIEDDNPKVKGESISRAISIFTELDCALDHDAAAEMSDNLSQLYRFIMDRLTRANLKKDLTALDEADQVLAHLHDGFREAVKTRKKSSRPESVESIEDYGDAAYPMSGKLSIAI